MYLPYILLPKFLWIYCHKTRVINLFNCRKIYQSKNKKGTNRKKLKRSKITK